MTQLCASTTGATGALLTQYTVAVYPNSYGTSRCAVHSLCRWFLQSCLKACLSTVLWCGEQMPR